MKNWNKEDERLKFEHNGFNCMILRSEDYGYLNGYVGLPITHPYCGKKYFSLLNLIILGGINFAEYGDEKFGFDKELYWIGFSNYSRDYKNENMESTLRTLRSLTEQLDPVLLAVNKLIGLKI